MRVDVTENEYRHAATAGFLRQVENLCRGRQDAFGYDGRGGYDVHVLGAVGEYVVAKALGLFWSGPGTLRAADVGSGTPLQVRATAGANRCLILHPGDGDSSVFVLVTGGPLRYHVRGWLRGSEGKRRAYWRDPVRGRPAYFVPQEALHGMSELLYSTPPAPAPAEGAACTPASS